MHKCALALLRPGNTGARLVALGQVFQIETPPECRHMAVIWGRRHAEDDVSSPVISYPWLEMTTVWESCNVSSIASKVWAFTS